MRFGVFLGEYQPEYIPNDCILFCSLDAWSDPKTGYGIEGESNNTCLLKETGSIVAGYR